MNTKTFRGAIVAVVAAVALAAAACDSGPTGTQYGRVSLFLTDAPGDVEMAVVTIDQIYLQGSGDSTDSTGGGRIVLSDEDITVDLLTLRDSLLGLFDSAAVPVGSYGQLRLKITGGYIQVAGADSGTSEIYASSPDYAGLPEGAVVTGELVMPSYAQSGLKVNVPGAIIAIGAGDLVVLAVDFDVAQSFGKLAGSGKWVMHPVINATELAPADTNAALIPTP